MKWDISKIDEWKAEEFPIGASIPEAGNSRDYRTGGWRSERPILDRDTCINCLVCWIDCPDSSIRVKDENLAPGDEWLDLDHCKGCGVCANECPVNALEMVPEGCELPGVK